MALRKSSQVQFSSFPISRSWPLYCCLQKMSSNVAVCTQRGVSHLMCLMAGFRGERKNFQKGKVKREVSQRDHSKLQHPSDLFLKVFSQDTESLRDTAKAGTSQPKSSHELSTFRHTGWALGWPNAQTGKANQQQAVASFAYDKPPALREVT